MACPRSAGSRQTVGLFCAGCESRARHEDASFFGYNFDWYDRWYGYCWYTYSPLGTGSSGKRARGKRSKAAQSASDSSSVPVESPLVAGVKDAFSLAL